VTKEDVEGALSTILIPGVKRSLTQLNMLREVIVEDGKVKVNLVQAGLEGKIKDWVKEKVIAVVKETPGVENVEVEISDVKACEINKIDRTIAVMSGKGGVGKSLVASLLGIALVRKGKEVGILDADVTGPSIPKMLGIGERPTGAETGILPVLSRSGIEVISINLLLPEEDDAVIWRGPLISKAIQQFWEEVVWGKLDFLIVDLPPGTADASLTVMQSLPLSGVVIVFTPQELAAMIVRKAVKMAEKMNTPILGMVENMSYFVTDRGEKIDIFGKSRAQEMATAARAPLLAQIPVDPRIAQLCDEGKIESYDSSVLDLLSENFFREIGGK
jgi:hydrogenase maturation protease